MNSSGRTPFKLFEGFLPHKGKDHQNYTDVWLVLLDSVIYVFTDSTIGKDTHIGKLTIDQYTEVHKRGGDHKSGYELELFTGNEQTRKRNEFKSSKKFIMEVWRGYLEGLAVGTVPNDLDLLPNQVSQIKCDIDFFLKRPRFNQYLRYGNFRNSRNRMSPADGGINVNGTSMTTQSSGITLCGGNNGGRTTVIHLYTRHRFTDDHDFVSDQTPSWFFENCSRQQAERILTIGKDFGNTLMRLSSTHKDHETYVISIMFRKETRFEHFEVLPVDNGYKLNVKNQHYAMSNLKRVMQFFVRTKGEHDTIPMKSNRLMDYGMMEEPDYATIYNTKLDHLEDAIDPFEPPATEEYVNQDFFNDARTGHFVNEKSRHTKKQSTPIRPPRTPRTHSYNNEVKLHHLEDAIDQFEPPATEDYLNQDFFLDARTGHLVNKKSRHKKKQSTPIRPPGTPRTHSYNNEANLYHLEDAIDLFKPPATEEYVNQDFFNDDHFVNEKSRHQESQSPPIGPPRTPRTYSYNNEEHLQNLHNDTTI